MMDRDRPTSLVAPRRAMPKPGKRSVVRKSIAKTMESRIRTTTIGGALKEDEAAALLKEGEAVALLKEGEAVAVAVVEEEVRERPMVDDEVLKPPNAKRNKIWYRPKKERRQQPPKLQRRPQLLLQRLPSHRFRPTSLLC
mmetsp:Transcript_54200/g.152311  ORF Transcript_54200/g.152311 Transcript_54200/m.152311 type:complete len:140 (+) Transcript_54200:599-1018(+)